MRLFFTLLFLLKLTTTYTQSELSIEKVRNNYLLLSAFPKQTFHSFDSLISIKNQLQNKIDQEVDIYLTCRTAFDDKFAMLESKAELKEYEPIHRLKAYQLRKDELYGLMAMDINLFNSWNYVETQRLQLSFDRNVKPELEKLQSLQEILMNYLDKIKELQNEARNKIRQYEKCQMDDNSKPGCEAILDEYERTKKLTEAYMSRYNSLLNERDGVNSIKSIGYKQYQSDYKTYYADYHSRKLKVDSIKSSVVDKIDYLEYSMDSLRPAVRRIILAELRKDINRTFKKEFSIIGRIDKIIISEFGSYEFYDELKLLQKRADLMVTTLNPDVDLKSSILRVNALQGNLSFLGPQGKKISANVLEYAAIQDDLKSLILHYEPYPYFTLNAYPQYYNDHVKSNMAIVNDLLDLGDGSLENRTDRFNELSEIDLSNTNFSLELIFKDHKNLKYLDLSNTRISSVKHLAGTEISWLDLSSTDISREALFYLKKLNKLEFLDLSDTNLHRKDKNDLCFYLKLNRKNCITK